MQAQELWKTLGEIQLEIDAGSINTVIGRSSKCPHCQKRMSVGHMGLSYRKDITDTTRKELTAHCSYKCLVQSFVAAYYPGHTVEVV